MALLADRAFTSRSTLRRVEEGDRDVGMGISAAVLRAPGLLDGPGRLADSSTDQVDLAPANGLLPQRVRLKKKQGVRLMDFEVQ